MKCLSIQQPWAWAIVAGHKDVENRVWAAAVRGWVLVHAGKQGDAAAFEKMLGRDLPGGVRTTPGEVLPFGAIVGAMRIDACVQSSASDWFCGPFGFVIGEAVALARPVPLRGMLGFFNVDLSEEMRTQLPAHVLEGAAK